MTTLRDPFETIHKKPLKNKAGQTVAELDYIGWSQAADRLDEVVGSWGFEIVGLGPDWCHGRLTIDGRTFENVGYAENAEADWKKEPLKDAVSDAFKRCAALAGVARYLYDKDTPSVAPRTAATPRPAPQPTPEPVRAASDPEEAAMWDGLIAGSAAPIASVPGNAWPAGTCPKHSDRAWKVNSKGAYCSARDAGTASGFCDLRPGSTYEGRVAA